MSQFRKASQATAWACNSQSAPAAANVRRRKRFILPAVIVTLGTLLCTQPYLNWKSTRFSERASMSLAKGNPTQAVLEAKVALSANATNLNASAQLADAYEALGDPRLLSILESLAGEKASLRYTRAALAFDEIELARQSLSAIHPENSIEAAEYNKLGVILAEKTSDLDALFHHLANLARGEDVDSGHTALLRLAGLIALSGNHKLEQDLQDQLEELERSDDERSLDATVLLWAISSRVDTDEDSPALASKWLDRLLMALSNDRHPSQTSVAALLRAMDFAIAFEDDGWRKMLSALQEKALAGRNPLVAGLVLQWMHRHNQYAEVAQWANHCSASLVPVGEDEDEVLRYIVLARLLVADACARSGDWQGIGRWCAGGEWGDHEYLRSLLLARALAGESKNEIPEAAQHWMRLAVGQALVSPKHLESLEAAVLTYGPRGLWLELHRGIGAKASNRKARIRSLLALKNAAIEIGNLLLFREATEQLTELKPDDWAEQHNALFAATLMDSVSASTVAALRELHNVRPDSDDITASLAMALVRTGSLVEAVATIESIEIGEREKPGIAPFCAIVYSLAGDNEKSKAYASFPAQLHFPESQRLFATATAGQ